MNIEQLKVSAQALSTSELTTNSEFELRINQSNRDTLTASIIGEDKQIMKGYAFIQGRLINSESPEEDYYEMLTPFGKFKVFNSNSSQSLTCIKDN